MKNYITICMYGKGIHGAYTSSLYEDDEPKYPNFVKAKEKVKE